MGDIAYAGKRGALWYLIDEDGNEVSDGYHELHEIETALEVLDDGS